MAQPVRIRLEPLGRTLEATAGESLRESLFPFGVEFPCGGRGTCRGCRVRVIGGALPVTPRDAELLAPPLLEQGWRLACHARPEQDIALYVEQWDASILSDQSDFAFQPAEGLGAAVDVGTTTLVAQLLDLQTGRVLAVRTALNPQARFGADLMSRVEHAVAGGGHARLVAVVRRRIGLMLCELLEAAAAPPDRLRRVILAGNTVMHHLFSNLSLEPLSHVPFETPEPGTRDFTAADLDWHDCGAPHVRFLPCLGGFVGSDLLAGAAAVHLLDQQRLHVLIDLGTNGEILFGNRERILCASTAAGPAFEGARISCGMRAATGAISEVTLREGAFACSVLGGGVPRGLCGSGLVDAVAASLELGLVLPGGRFRDRAPALPLCDTVSLSQTDIRELQLAKGAIAAGMRILQGQWGAEQPERVHIAGAFGNYVNLGSARRIGLLEQPPALLRPAGNTALLGCKMLLFHPDMGDALSRRICALCTHCSLSADPAFHDAYVDCMLFPEA